MRGMHADVLVCPYLDHYFEKCLTETAFSYGLIQASKASDHHDVDAHFDAHGSLLLGGLTIWGHRSVEHFSKKSANTATYATAENGSDEVGIDTTTSSSGSSGDYAWRSIPQKPGSFYIGNFSAVKHKVAHAVESPECIGLHITAKLHTSIFGMGRNGAAHEPAGYCYNHELGESSA